RLACNNVRQVVQPAPISRYQEKTPGMRSAAFRPSPAAPASRTPPASAGRRLKFGVTALLDHPSWIPVAPARRTYSQLEPATIPSISSLNACTFWYNFSLSISLTIPEILIGDFFFAVKTFNTIIEYLPGPSV